MMHGYWDDRWFRGWNDPWWTAGGWVMMIGMVVLTVAVVVLVISALRQWPRLSAQAATRSVPGMAAAPQAAAAPPAPPAPAESPLDIARRRYAAGEIDRDTYLQLVADLSGQTTGSAGQA